VRLYWQLEAATGATTASAAARLATLPRQPVDAALVVLGVNDVTRLSDLSRVREQRIEIANRLREDFGASNVVMTGVPPMGDFPLLPQPLRGRLGQRAARLDRALAGAAAQSGFQYLPFTLPLRPDDMARDGFHPAPLAYRVWAETLGPHLLPGPSALP
jgi:lysophospholipase L1-like esterase